MTIAPDYNQSALHADLWLSPRPGTDAALALAACQVVIEEKLYRADYLREQTDLPFLVRGDTRRFLRESDVVEGGRDDIFALWDEAQAEIIWAPGSWGSTRKTLELPAGVRPALEARAEVRLASGARVPVSTVFSLLRQRLDGFRPEQAGRITGVAPDVIRGFARDFARARRRADPRRLWRMQELPLGPEPALADPSRLPDGEPRPPGGRLALGRIHRSRRRRACRHAGAPQHVSAAVARGAGADGPGVHGEGGPGRLRLEHPVSRGPRRAGRGTAGAAARRPGAAAPTASLFRRSPCQEPFPGGSAAGCRATRGGDLRLRKHPTPPPHGPARARHTPGEGAPGGRHWLSHERDGPLRRHHTSSLRLVRENGPQVRARADTLYDPRRSSRGAARRIKVRVGDILAAGAARRRRGEETRRRRGAECSGPGVRHCKARRSLQRRRSFRYRGGRGCSALHPEHVQYLPRDHSRGLAPRGRCCAGEQPRPGVCNGWLLLRIQARQTGDAPARLHGEETPLPDTYGTPAVLRRPPQVSRARRGASDPQGAPDTGRRPSVHADQRPHPLQHPLHVARPGADAAPRARREGGIA